MKYNIPFKFLKNLPYKLNNFYKNKSNLSYKVDNKSETIKDFAPVTNLDRSFEKYIRLLIHKSFLNDSIIGEELGLFRGTLPLLIAFLYIFYRGIKISQKCTDPFGILLATGLSMNIVLYAFVNASVATGLFPVTGLPMPMISYGGSGLLINMAMIGILLNISQAKRSISGGLNWRNFNFG